VEKPRKAIEKGGNKYWGSVKDFEKDVKKSMKKVKDKGK
jgi:hypothetical protein